MRLNKTLLIGILTMTALGSCGKANSDSTHAETVMSPRAGYTCFVIRDNDGKAVGGNCVKD
jgi:hypothetical protein